MEPASIDPTKIASRFINSTMRHVFLTGKAGTGKTTFLKQIAKTTHKNHVIAAPTGIAALNAGGVTLHSLLQLPFGSFIPSEDISNMQTISDQIHTPSSLVKKVRFNKPKMNMLREMELLIIDEVSMLRADVLDAIDVMLRRVRFQKNQPFGGVQILFIGDLLQLPPVIKDREWKYLSPYYQSAFFFEAKALQNNKPIYIELMKVYRQDDPKFVAILNHFRDNAPTQDDLDTLNNTCYTPSTPKNKDGAIFLTTHNRKADEKNAFSLKQLKGKSHYFDAEIDGDFPEHIYPVEFKLELKKDAQVMFIKNDYSGEQRYFNGKIGKVKSINDEDITVSFDDGSPSTTVELYTWENKRFTLNNETNEIQEKIIGTFMHFPIKLAWAITVHKSQGLTFHKAELDLSAAFAPGQVYVALSRLSSLQGLVLSSPLRFSNLRNNEIVAAYAENKEKPEVLTDKLKSDSREFLVAETLKAFDFGNISKQLYYHIQSYDKDEKKSAKQKFKSWAEELANSVKEPKEVAEKFQVQLRWIMNNPDPDQLQNLLQRIQAAKGFFEPLLKGFSKKVFGHSLDVENEKGVKKYRTELTDIELLFFKQLHGIYKAEALVKSTIENAELQADEMHKSELYVDRRKVTKEYHADEPIRKRVKEKKEKKIPTRDITLALYREGKSIAEIAKERSLTIGTIEGHFIPFIKSGEVKLAELVDKIKIAAIIEAVAKLDTYFAGPLKEKLGDNFSYGEIRLVLASMYEDKTE